MYSRYKVLKSKGIALIQVLFLSAIISVFVMSITLHVNQHIKTAEQIVQHAEATIALYSLEAKTLFDLNTKPWRDSVFYQHPIAGDSLYSHQAQWDEGTVMLASIESRVSIYNFDLIHFLLERNGVEQSELDHVMYLWKNAVRSGFDNGTVNETAKPVTLEQRKLGIQFEEELLAISDNATDAIRKIEPLLTLYPMKGIYPFGMTRDVLAFYISEPILSNAIALKQEGKLSADFFRPHIPGSEFLIVSEQPGPVYELVFTAQVKDVKLRRRAVLTIAPHGALPVSVWEYHKID